MPDFHSFSSGDSFRGASRDNRKSRGGRRCESVTPQPARRRDAGQEPELEDVDLANVSIAGPLAAKERTLVESGALDVVRSVYRKHFSDSGHTFEELLGAGFLGVYNAARTFDPRVGTKFTTHVWNGAYRKMQEAARGDGAVVRAPRKNVAKINKFVNEYSLANGADPTVVEIAAGTKMNEKIVLDTLNAEAPALDATVDAREDADGAMTGLSLEANVQSPLEILALKERQGTIDQIRALYKDARKRLAKREREIFETVAVDGLRGSAQRMAEKYAISVERVRQIRLEAAEKLRGWYARHGVTHAV